MPFIGLRYPVVATLASHTDGSAPTYNAGKVAGHAIQANLTIDRNDNPLYGDDRVIEDDNGITGMSIDLGLDDLTEEVQSYMLGTKEVTSGTGTSAVTTYIDTDETAPYVGFGYIRVRRKDGATAFQATWYHKAVFSYTGEDAQTKGETIEWQTPTVTGRIMGISADSSGALQYRQRRNFDTEAAAMAWLNGLAGITQ